MEKALSDMLTNDGFWINMVTTSEKTDVISVYGPKVSTATPKVVTIGKDQKNRVPESAFLWYWKAIPLSVGLGFAHGFIILMTKEHRKNERDGTEAAGNELLQRK